MDFVVRGTLEGLLAEIHVPRDAQKSHPRGPLKDPRTMQTKRTAWVGGGGTKDLEGRGGEGVCELLLWGDVATQKHE